MCRYHRELGLHPSKPKTIAHNIAHARPNTPAHAHTPNTHIQSCVALSAHDHDHDRRWACVRAKTACFRRYTRIHRHMRVTAIFRKFQFHSLLANWCGECVWMCVCVRGYVPITGRPSKHIEIPPKNQKRIRAIVCTHTIAGSRSYTRATLAQYWRDRARGTRASSKHTHAHASAHRPADPEYPSTRARFDSAF